VWLRRIPSLIAGHFWVPSSTGAERVAFEQQAAQDWEPFLSMRLARCGLVLASSLCSGLEDDGSPRITELMDYANAARAEMVDEGTITAQERGGVVLGSYPRRESELLAPFAKEGHVRQLMVEDCEVSAVPDTASVEYQQDGDKEPLARKKALFFRAVFVPSLASALARVRDGDGEKLRRLADRLQDGLTRPSAMSCAVTE
jgi:hypothetical protein